MPTYDDGSTPTLVTEKPPAVMLKVRGGADTYMKPDGSVGTAGKGALASEEVSFTVAATQDQTLFQPVDFRHGEVGEGDDATQTMQAKSTGGYSLNYMPGATDGYVVRRLTPTECERLQGFPDGWTDLTGCDADAVAEKVAASLHYDERKSAALLRKVRKWSQECPDGPRYKACGNSMAVPNMRWIFERVQAYDTMRKTKIR